MKCPRGRFYTQDLSFMRLTDVHIASVVCQNTFFCFYLVKTVMETQLVSTERCSVLKSR